MPERQRQRDAFERYWRLGPQRSIERLHAAMAAEERGPSLRTLYEWSRRYHWQARTADVERQAAAAADEARVQAMKEMYERQAREGLLLQQKGAEWLSSLRAVDVSAEAAIRAISEGAKLERLARGEPSEREVVIQDEAADTRLRDLSDSELADLIEYAERAVARASEAKSE